MTPFYYIIGGLVCLILLSSFFSMLKMNCRKSEFKDWQVGDYIVPQDYSEVWYEIKKRNQDYVRIVGWTKDDLYFEIDGTICKRSWKNFKHNKSALWRRNHEECKKQMGKEPGFDPTVHVTESTRSSKVSGQIDGKSIETMNETECQIYLKKAIEEEDYHTAELIRKRLENFR